MKKIIVKKDSKPANFLIKVVKDKDQIRKHINSGKPLSQLSDKGIKFVQPL